MQKNDNYRQLKQLKRYIVHELEGEFAIKVAIKATAICEDKIIMSLVEDYLSDVDCDKSQMEWIVDHMVEEGIDSYFDGDIAAAAAMFDHEYIQGRLSGLSIAIETLIDAKYIN